MRILSLFLFISFSIMSSLAQSQEVKVVDFPQLEKTISEGERSKIQVYNFWATWCKPCIIEMPHFEEVAKKYSSDISLTFVSLDFEDNLEKKVEPFVQKKGIKSKVLLLNDTDYNTWIDKVDPRWSGGLPATLIVDRNGKKHFFEKEFELEELDHLISELIN